jgi:hypothetical protein
VAREKNQQIKIDHLQSFPVFNLDGGLSSRLQHDSFSVIPNNTKSYDPMTVLRWQLMMVCYKAANNDGEKAEHYFNNIDYAKVFEYYTLNCASKING